MIIVDDGSADETEEVVREYALKDERIKYFKNPGKGGAAARNFGVSKAKGEYIAFLDDDDISLPHRFESQLKAARENDKKFIVSGYEVRERKTDRLKAIIKLDLKGQGAGFRSRWLIEKELLNKVRGFDEDFPSMQDIELSYRLAMIETFAMHNDVVSVLYSTDNSVSLNKNNAAKGKILLLERLGLLMLPEEAAWWYFETGLTLYALDDRDNALKHIKKAALLTKGAIYYTGYFYALLMFHFTGIFKILNQRVLKLINNLGFPVIVEHPIINS